MKKIKDSRAASFLIIAIVYVIAAAAGIAVYLALPLDWWIRLLIADVVATVVTFAFSCIFGNSSVYDPYWSVQPIVIIVAYAVGCGQLNAMRILLLISICFWGIRLTANWAYTFKNLNAQDWRYSSLKEQNGKLYPLINFIGIHMMPTMIVYCCVLPVAYSFTFDVQANVGSIIFTILAVAAATMQAIADIQMHAYRRHRNGNFIRSGLWKYSRHPNYLGEILMWWFVGLTVVVADLNAWYLLSGAVFNTLLFLVISIPLAEGRQSKKEGFEEYKAQTRMLLPIYKRQYPSTTKDVKNA